VETLGWYWVSRVRDQRYIKLGSESDWISANSLHPQATATPKAMGEVELARSQAHLCQLVIYKGKAKGRHEINRHGNRFCWPLTQDGQVTEVFVNPVFVVNDPSSINVALLNGMGIGLMPEPFAVPSLNDGCLRRVLVPWSGPAVELNAVFPPGRMHTPKVRAFVDFLVAQLDLKGLA
jgi:DNA-binding transcriptional LysR family regulator